MLVDLRCVSFITFAVPLVALSGCIVPMEVLGDSSPEASSFEAGEDAPLRDGSLVISPESDRAVIGSSRTDGSASIRSTDSVVELFADGSRPDGDALARCRQALPGISPLSADAQTRYDNSALSSSQQFELSGSGEWDDNANYQRFQGLIAEAPVHEAVDISNRQFVVVLDEAGRGVGNCSVQVKDAHGTSAMLTTLASGRTPVFPELYGLRGPVTVAAHCLSQSGTATLSLESVDEVATIRLDAPRTATNGNTLDLAFVLDVTGSMSAEIQAMKQTIDAVATEIVNAGKAQVRLALVAYRDYGDAPSFEVVHFTQDLEAFRGFVASLGAVGGGDTPEAVNEAMARATSLDWNLDASARLTFVIGDAPPHPGEDHSAARAAAVLACGGVKVFTVATTGQDPTGRFIFRQMSQLSSATHLFLLRGELSADSECADYEFRTGSLHSLVTERVFLELASLEQDPFDIPGLGADRDTEVAEALAECAEQASIAAGEELAPIVR